jgi:hypothetical protein
MKQLTERQKSGKSMITESGRRWSRNSEALSQLRFCNTLIGDGGVIIGQFMPFCLSSGLSGSRSIPGCGEGHDAIRLGKLGAAVPAFVLARTCFRSPAIERAKKREMAAEQLKYDADTGDVVFARDVLHHCDLAQCLPEFLRGSNPSGAFVFDELYTHHLLQLIRESVFVAGCDLSLCNNRRVRHGRRA